MSRKRAFALLRTFIMLVVLVIVVLALTHAGPFSSGSSQGESEVAEEGNGDGASGAGGSEAARRPNLKESNPEPPTIAIVVDDTGSSSDTLDLWLKIDAPLTFAVFPYCTDLHWMIEKLYDQGYEIMLHMPTENNPPDSYSGYGQLNVGMTREEAFAALDKALASVPHAEGINNHQGGKGCNDLQLMTYMCEWAKERGLYVVDSNASTHSMVSEAAVNLGMPRRRNQVFIDNKRDPESLRAAMRTLADVAREKGTAIGICHFNHPNVPRVVGEMIEVLRAEGFHFAFVRDVSN
ncbi:MAG: divergent polysaccharide deacetylase family protein [Actinobacteria bacterium]|nr:divergent polysaccharide deacetylase family protein [Actinomycetota bacterium]